MRILDPKSPARTRLKLIFVLGTTAIVFTWLMINALSDLQKLKASSAFIGILVYLASAAFVAGVFLSIASVFSQFANHFTSSNVLRKETRSERRAIRRRQAKIRQQQLLEAQLTKPDFSSRLKNFTNQAVTDEPFVSKAKFWQAETDYQPSQPRSISFIRRLLMRISKHVNKSRM